MEEWPGMSGGTEENHENPRPASRDFNPGPPKYEPGILTTRPRRSVRKILKWTLEPGQLVVIQ
jgi:hypothetical protein